jgi:hypothetical protein
MKQLPYFFPIPMRYIFLIPFVCSFVAVAQTAPPSTAPKPAAAPPAAAAAGPVTPDNKVVATIDGKDYTAGEVRALVDKFPPQIRSAFAQNPTRALNFIFMMQYLADQAQFHNLDKEPEFQQDFLYTRLNLLSQAELNNYRNTYQPTYDEQKAYYDEHAAQYEQAHVKVIYISFVSGAMKGAGKELDEAGAKAKIEDLRKQILAGADFSKLAAENSEDKASAAKGGDFGIITRVSPYPEVIKSTVFALKEGEVSEPVRQPNGYYLFKLAKLDKQSFNDVQSKVFEQLKQDHFNQWVKGIEKRYTVNVKDSQFFAGHPPR